MQVDDATIALLTALAQAGDAAVGHASLNPAH
jgi:hypothetical protein